MISPTVTAAWIALAGTLVTVGVGYWQWRRQPAGGKSTPFDDERRAAYKELWDRVEQVHLELRDSPVSADAIAESVSGINSFLIRNAMYFDEDLRPLVSRYVEALVMLTTSIEQSDDQEAKSNMSATAEFTVPRGTQSVQAEAALKTASALRQQILTLCRDVVRGK